MNAREDRIYQLQQALAAQPPGEWRAYLVTECGHDTGLVEEVIDRQQRLSAAPNTPVLFGIEPTPPPQLEPSSRILFGSEATRFTLRRQIGSGGFGVVYQVYDQQLGLELALKTLRHFAPNDLYRLKREFRGLADVRHPNLVTLHELFVTDHSCFFTMELIDGHDWLERARTYVLDGGQAAMASLRSLGRQLADAINSLHEAGKQHGDLKPSNVLVTRGDRVVVLDFGIASELASSRSDSLSQLAGTPAYMAPEAFDGVSSKANDWYSFGAMLHEVLTGEPPFSGTAWEVFRQKIDHEPPLIPGSVGADLSALATVATALLAREPSARPGYDAIAAALGTAIGRVPHARSTTATELTGRADELRTLHEHFGTVAAGASAVICVEGVSGVGKTSLIRQFTDDLAMRTDAVVISGRCYQQETVPFKALDGVVDALSHRLKTMPAASVAAVMPRHFEALTSMFPVLGRVFPATPTTSTTLEGRPLHEGKRRSREALRELLARIGDRWPIVAVVDDAQWGDFDSAALLSDLLRPPDAPRMLLLLSYRSGEADTSRFLQPLLGSLREGERSTLSVHILPLRELGQHAARELARQLLPGPAADAIADESGGNPFFIRALTNHAASGSIRKEEKVTLTQVVLAQIERVPEESKKILQVLAVAGSPLPFGLVSRLGNITEPRAPAIDALRRAGLVRVVTTPEGSGLEPYHDRIREIVIEVIDADERRHLHGQLAASLEASDSRDSEAIAFHYEGSGGIAKASQYFEHAADHSMAAFAFDRAARLYRNAVRLRGTSSPELRVRLGDALAAAGRGASAADEYMQVATTVPLEQRIELLRRAAEQLLISGNTERGLEVIQSVLPAVGLRLPRSSTGALVSLLTRRALVMMRGIRYRERPESSLSDQTRLRIDTCWSVAVGMSMVDPIRGSDFQARHLLLALRAGEPFRIARALAIEVGHRGLGGAFSYDNVLPLVDHARAAARRLDKPYTSALIELTTGALAWMNGDWPTCVQRSVAAERMLVEQCGAPPWETGTAHIFELAGLLWMGRLSDHRARMPTLIQDAKDRGDLYAQISIPLLGYAHVARLAYDQPEGAFETVARLDAAWTHRQFDLQRFWATYARAEIHLYKGEGAKALETVASVRRAVQRSLLLRGQTMRLSWLYLQGRCALAAAREHRNANLHNVVRRIVRQLERERVEWSKPLANTLSAAIRVVAGDTNEGITLLRKAEREFEGVHMELHAACAGYLRRQLSREGDGGISPVFEREGVARPERMAAALLWAT